MSALQDRVRRSPRTPRAGRLGVRLFFGGRSNISVFHVTLVRRWPRGGDGWRHCASKSCTARAKTATAPGKRDAAAKKRRHDVSGSYRRTLVTVVVGSAQCCRRVLNCAAEDRDLNGSPPPWSFRRQWRRTDIFERTTMFYNDCVIRKYNIKTKYSHA